jgi:heme oxygenase (biliverdin-IX-beta and delta-forming)
MVLSGCVSQDILTKLREHTRAAHTALEGKLDWAAICRDPDSYRNMLARFYGFVSPWEASVREQIKDPLLAKEFDSRWKSGLLANDLLALGCSSEKLAEIERMPDHRFVYGSEAALLGAAYVMEGSTLGGQMISRMLAERLNLSEHNGCSYFSSYRAHVGAMWKRFGELLRQRLVNETEKENATASAVQTFAAMDEWLSGASVGTRSSQSRR